MNMGIVKQMSFLITFDLTEHALASQCNRNHYILSAFTCTVLIIWFLSRPLKCTKIHKYTKHAVAEPCYTPVPQN
jgi:hypothetical protein